MTAPSWYRHLHPRERSEADARAREITALARQLTALRDLQRRLVRRGTMRASRKLHKIHRRS